MTDPRTRQRLAPGLDAYYSQDREGHVDTELLLPALEPCGTELHPQLRFSSRFLIRGYHLWFGVGTRVPGEGAARWMRRIVWGSQPGWNTVALSVRLDQLAERLRQRERTRQSKGYHYYQVSQLLGGEEG